MIKDNFCVAIVPLKLNVVNHYFKNWVNKEAHNFNFFARQARTVIMTDSEGNAMDTGSGLSHRFLQRGWRKDPLHKGQAAHAHLVAQRVVFFSFLPLSPIWGDTSRGTHPRITI